MTHFFTNLIEAYRTADLRDDFNMYDYIGAFLASILLVAIFILASMLEQ